MPKEYREERLVSVLREQLHANIQGVQESVIVTHDGLVVAVYPVPADARGADNDAENSHWVAALAAEILAQSQRAFGRLTRGAVGRILIEGDEGSMIVVPAGEQASLAVMVDTSTKLGIAMFQIVRVAQQIGDLLEN